MDIVCLANTCNGTRCKKKKVNVNYCKIHTTNEICTLCGSTQISSTDSILQRSGKSLCYPCRVVEGNKCLDYVRRYVAEHAIRNL